VERGDDTIARHVGERPAVFAYPYGYYDDRVRDIVASRYRYSVTTEMSRLSTHLADPHRVPRLETFYFRAPAVHARFGSRSFSAYLAARAALRNWRKG
jgi:peptidoglycan/xylan/chitin deacetylase (PgdA/CDA1 family)